MSCKIIDIRTGEEIKKPAACLRGRPAKLATRSCKNRIAAVQGGQGFEQVGLIAGRIVRRLEART